MRLIPLITLAALALLFAATAIYAWCQGWYASAGLMGLIAAGVYSGLVQTHKCLEAMPTEAERSVRARLEK